MNSTNNIINLNKVREALHRLGRFSEKELHILSSHLKEVIISKDFYLLKEGQTCQSLYFVIQGSFRHYQITDSGHELTHNLYLENDWMLDYKSFTAQQPSTSNIQATEDSEVLELSVYNLHELMKTSDSFFQIGRIFQFALDQQGLQLQHSTPKERYIFLLNNKPQLIQRFPLKYIASYLGMTPETLSRVRRFIAA